MRQSKDPLERYDTPGWMTRLLWDDLSGCISKSYDIIEPCAGAGAIVREFSKIGIWTSGFDIEPRHETITQADTINKAFWENTSKYYAGMITNPPFSRGAELLTYALPHVGFAIMLVRLNFLEYVGSRKDLSSPQYVMVLPRMRPWFTGNKTDSVTVCWAVWAKEEYKFPTGIRCYNKSECQKYLECE